MTASGALCSPNNADVYLTDEQGNRVYDTRVVDQIAINFERSVAMQGISKTPGMNGMSVIHDQWLIDFSMGPITNVASIGPAIYFMYLGTDSGVRDLIVDSAVDGPVSPRVLSGNLISI